MDLDELERLERAATAGPWTHETGAPHHPAWIVSVTTDRDIVQVFDGSQGKVADSWGSERIGDPRCHESNAAFIAALRNAAPSLLAIARAAHAYRAAWAAYDAAWSTPSLPPDAPYTDDVAWSDWDKANRARLDACAGIDTARELMFAALAAGGAP
jgi:hypothetical protein